MASRESDQLKLKCYAIRIALLSEYIRNNVPNLPKQNVSTAFALHGWGYTLRNPIANFDTIMDDDVVAKYRKIPTLKRAHMLLTNLQKMVSRVGHETPWDLKVWLRRSSTTNEDCERLQQLYNEDCIDVGA